MSKPDIKFEVSTNNARLHKYIPKHAKADDAPVSAELQFRNVRIHVRAAGAILLAEDGGPEIVDAFLKGEHFEPRFRGIKGIPSDSEFKARHKITIDDLDTIRVESIDKIVVRIEGGPQQIAWADFSAYIEDPSAEQGAHFHEQINRDVKLILKQERDLVDEMIANARGMAVSDVTPPNGELAFNEKGAEQIDQVATELEKPPKKSAARRPAKKAAKKKAA
jgi:ribosome-associated translation inhibitor RaiA